MLGLNTYALGPAKVVALAASGTALHRTARLARLMTACSIGLAFPMRPASPTREHEREPCEPPDMVLVHRSTPYAEGWCRNGVSGALHVEADQLGLPMDTVQRATPTLRRSPLYALVHTHVSQVTQDAAVIAGSEVATQVGMASVALMRALIVSAAQDDGAQLRDAMHISMAARVQTYVHLHLRDADLSPDTVAAANGLSIRSLYSLYETLGVSLEQSIIEQRLEGARADLASARHAHRSIATIARGWGFNNPGFFSTRFRSRYGITPRQWRAAQRDILQAQ